jgi:two-component system chemotaxis sensor kinase CheA
VREDLEQLLSAVVATDADDLPALAGLHGRLQEFEKELREARLTEQAEGAVAIWKQVETVALGESRDPARQMEAVANELAQLADLVRAALSGEGSTVGAGPVKAVTNSPGGDAKASTEEGTVPTLTEDEIKADDQSLVQEFITEAGEHVAEVERGLLSLEGDPGALETLNSVFRGFHSIKGAAGFLHLRQIAALSHAGESVLDAARHGKLVLRGEAMEAVLASVDGFKGLLSDLSLAIAQGRAPHQFEGLSELLCRLGAALRGEAPATAAEPAAGHPSAPARLESPSSAVAATATNMGDGSVKVSTARLDQLINMVGELVIAESMVAQDCSIGREAQQGNGVRLARNLSQLAKITRELQELSMSLRMVPVQGVFQKLTRLVRDTSRKLGKDVELVLEGGETELDRTLVDSLSDPLVHMVRNSLDHGIETPEVREAAGKPRAGKLTLRARHEAGCVVIEVVDDGKGIDGGRVLRKARDAGIVSEHQQLTDGEIYKLIFHPGLSTAEKVTDVSGRGVGMDVVRRNVEKLRGRIEITSSPGKGSAFTIRLPLTLAVIDGLLVAVGKHTYIIPLTSVERNLRPTVEQLPTVFDRGEMCLIRGDLLPLVRLHRVFEVEPDCTDPTRSLVVIVHDDARRCCLLVDRLLGQQQVVIKSLGYGASGIQGIAGGAILGDGNVSLILDVPGLIDVAATRPSPGGLRSSEDESERKRT